MARLRYCPVCGIGVGPQELLSRHPVTGAEGPERPDESDDQAWLDWHAQSYELTCAHGHPLPHRVLSVDTLVMSYVGQPTAGKSTMIKQLGKALNSTALSGRGLITRTSLGSRRLFDDLYDHDQVPGTETAHADSPHLSVVFEIDSLVDGRRRPAMDVMVFDCGGEDIFADDGENVRQRTPFLPVSDVVVFALPPAGLPGLPDDLRVVDLAQTKVTEAWFAQASAWIGLRPASRAPEDQVVVVALTKADRYRTGDRFVLPAELLRARRLQSTAVGLDETLAAEQPALFAFTDRAGGGPLLELAAQVNDTVFLTAVSGAAPDDETKQQLFGMAPNRSLDPLLIALMRRGLGRFSTAAGPA
ncbi:MAG TPA: hypothetical protein VGC67_09800 [Cellulomonas sp.]